MMRLMLLLCLTFPVGARADSFALILNGIAGSPEHEERFAQWTESTRAALVDNFGFSDSDVLVLTRPNAEDIRMAFRDFAVRSGEDDVFYLFLIGHGSYDGREYKFNIARADLTASDYGDLLSTLSVGRSVVVNGTPSSGASIKDMAGPGRIIITATRSGSERNDTIFYEHFLDGLSNPASDEDLNERLSVWEAFRFATLGVERYYEELNLLATEHPQISDNGGEQTDAEPEDIPALAQLTHFSLAVDIDIQDPILRSLLEERAEIEAAIADLRLDREVLSEDAYELRLEDLFVELALTNRRIRAQEGAQ